jgi:hypothetical protein
MTEMFYLKKIDDISAFIKINRGTNGERERERGKRQENCLLLEIIRRQVHLNHFNTHVTHRYLLPIVISKHTNNTKSADENPDIRF